MSFRLPEPLMERFRALAKRNRRTLSGEAQVAFENHLAADGTDHSAGGKAAPKGKTESG